MIVSLILFILFLIIVHSWLMFVKDSRKMNIPGPLPLPIIGNANLFFGDSTKMLPTLECLALKYNDAARFYILSNRYVVLSHPKYVEHLLSSSELINKGRLFDIMKPWLGEGLVSASGAKWKKNRRTLTPAFHFNALKSFLPVFLKNEKILRAKLKIVGDGTTPIDIYPLLNIFAFDNITEAGMGICFHAQTLGGSEYAAATQQMTHIFSARVGNPYLANDFIFQLTPHKVKLDKAIEVVNKYSHKAIIESRQKLLKTDLSTFNNEESGLKTFIDLVLLAGQNGNAMDDDQIISEVNTFLFAGHDTVSTTSAFALYCISNHKEVQERLFEEQERIFRDDMDRDPTHSDLQEMKYLELVIKETLRLYPIAPVIERLISKDVDLAGLQLQKDTLVFVNIFQMQRNPKVYDNPLEFQPERFENSEIVKSPFSWIPFSAGPRNCIGQRFAMLQMKVTLSLIIKHFKLLPAGIQPILANEMVLKSKNGVYINLLPRVKLI